MATTYKLYSSAAADGTAFIDLPIGGKIIEISWAVLLVAGAGGVGAFFAELSRQAVNQVQVNNPRGVISLIALGTAAASIPIAHNTQVHPDEPVRAGERIYLNTGSAINSNVASSQTTVFVTIA